jgi:predicted Zn-dependent peptidase
MKYYLVTIILVLSAGCAPSLSSIALNQEQDIFPLDHPQIKKHMAQARHFYLENGLEVLAIRNSSSPMVGLNLAIRVGSAFEDYSTSGMSHMLEHLLFNGTSRRTQEELYEETDYFGAYSNAHTDKFFTNFMLLLPAEFIEQGMDIQADMLFNSTLPKTKFNKERGIVMEEIRKDRDSEGYIISNFFQRMNFGETGAGLSTLGTLSTIEHLSRDETFDFYKVYYVPNNMTLTIIGDYDPDQLKTLLEEYYGAYPPRPIKLSPPSPHPIENGRINQMSGPITRSTGQVVFEAPAFAAPGHLCYEILINLLDEELKAALPGTNVSVSYTAHPDLGLLVIQFSAEDGKSTFARVVQELKRIDERLEEVITPESLALLVKQRSVEDYSLLESPHYYGMLRAVDLALGGGAYVLDRLATLASITSQQVLKIAQGFTYKPHHFNLFYPATATDIEEASEESVLEKSILKSGAELITSSGGGSRMFGMHILIKNRHVIEDSLEGGAEILHSLLESGTDQYTRDQLNKKLKSIGATLKVMDLGFIPYDDYYNRPDYGYIRFECLAEDAKEGIALIAHMLGHTVLDEQKVEQAITGARRRIGMKRATARYMANKEFTKLLRGYEHPSARSVSGSSGSLQRMTLENLQALQRSYFQPANFLISISSPLPHAELAQLFHAIWPVPGSPSERITTAMPTPEGKQEATFELGKEQAQIRIGYTFKIDSQDKPAFALMTALLSYKMMFDLRETRGLAYSLSLRDGYDGDSAWLEASMGTGIDNLDEAIKGLKSYFSADRLRDLSQRELEKTVNARKGRYMMRTLTRIGQAYYLGYHEYYDGDHERAISRLAECDELTIDDVKRIAAKYLDLPENHTLVVVK